MSVLSRNQHNDVYTIAEKAGLKPLDFDLTSAKQQYRELVETYTHRPTKCWIDFSFGQQGGG